MNFKVNSVWYVYRDTPHHLKNKRVQQTIDKSSNLILSQAMKQKTPPLTQQVGLPIQEEPTQLEPIKSGDEDGSQEGK